MFKKQENLAFLFLSTAFPCLFQEAGKTILNRNFRIPYHTFITSLSHLLVWILSKFWWHLIPHTCQKILFHSGDLPPYVSLLCCIAPFIRAPRSPIQADKNAAYSSSNKIFKKKVYKSWSAMDRAIIIIRLQIITTINDTSKSSFNNDQPQVKQ